MTAKKNSEITQIRKDMLALIDCNELDAETYKNLCKGILNDFFDYLEEKLG